MLTITYHTAAQFARLMAYANALELLVENDENAGTLAGTITLEVDSHREEKHNAVLAALLSVANGRYEHTAPGCWNIVFNRPA